MTRDEFNEWLPYHFGAFPDLETWLAKMPESSQQNFLARRAGQVQDIPMSALAQATDEMARDQFDGFASKNFDHVMTTARAIVSRRRELELSRTRTPTTTDEPPNVTTEEIKQHWLEFAESGNHIAVRYCLKQGWIKDLEHADNTE